MEKRKELNRETFLQSPLRRIQRIARHCLQKYRNEGGSTKYLAAQEATGMFRLPNAHNEMTDGLSNERRFDQVTLNASGLTRKICQDVMPLAQELCALQHSTDRESFYKEEIIDRRTNVTGYSFVAEESIAENDAKTLNLFHCPSVVIDGENKVVNKIAAVIDVSYLNNNDIAVTSQLHFSVRGESDQQLFYALSIDDKEEAAPLMTARSADGTSDPVEVDKIAATKMVQSAQDALQYSIDYEKIGRQIDESIDTK